MGRLNQAIIDAAETATQVLLRGVPRTATSGDVRRAIAHTDIKGVSKVELFYSHSRPTGKAVLTMSLPDYTRDAIRQAQDVIVAGSPVLAEALYNPYSNRGKARPLFGDGPSAGVPLGRGVTLCGFPGKLQAHDVKNILKGFKVQSIKHVPLPAKRFSLYSRFNVVVESESEAHRLVRKFHMTPYKNISTLRAAVIY